jgi:hypothetical protein
MTPPRWHPLRRKRSSVSAQVRDLRRRAVVVGTLVVMSLLGLAAPANADSWRSIGSYAPREYCVDLGVDRVRSGRAAAYRCLKYPNQNLWLLQVIYPRVPRPQ